jgi:two-component system, NtrC family, response regulator HydG
MTDSPVLLGVSPAIRVVEEEIAYAARSSAKVLITGESGVGKEVVARLIHERSSRARVPLVAINCAGIPDSLLESELFGHVRGSFTDAHRDRTGWIESARGGTIFLDEIGEMSLRMQALLLRFLETGEIQRVGADSLTPSVDVRVIAATHRRLVDMVADHTFREDLYYRLNVIHIDVPPLRERREDVAILVNHFLRICADANGFQLPEVTPEAMRCLVEYSWPGNVRELRNTTERLVLRHSSGRITLEGLPAEIYSEARAQFALNDGPSAAARAATPELLFERIVKNGGSFWSVAYEPFMARDLTRRELRDLVRFGLEQTRGNYKLLVTTFNMAPSEYKKFLNFLRKYQCHVPFQTFRMTQPRAGEPGSAQEMDGRADFVNGNSETVTLPK